MSVPEINLQGPPVIVQINKGNNEVVQVKAKVVQVEVKFDNLLIRINALSVSSSDSEFIALYGEFEVLVQEQDGLVLQVKASGQLQDAEIKESLQEGINKRLLIARKLIGRLREIKDSALRALAAQKLGKVLAGTDRTLDEAGLAGRGNLTEITREFLETCQALGIELESTLSSQLAAIAQLNQKDKEPSSLSKDELSFELLSIFQKYDSSQKIWELIAQWEKEREKMLEEAEEEKQKERLEEARLEEKRKEEKQNREEVENKKHEVVLALKGTEYKKQTAVDYIKRIEAEIAENLFVIELEHLKRKNLPLVA
jgi:hypothetical protein